jgi:glycosyltransferase involved in cell wall biosynthesis
MKTSFNFATMKKRVLVLVFSNLKHDARVARQVFFLAKHFKVTLVCFDADTVEGVNVIKLKQTKLTIYRKLIIGFTLLFRAYNIAYNLLHSYKEKLSHSLSKTQFDLVIGNDVETLPLAFHFRGNAKVMLDAHEYAPRHFEDKFFWRLFFQNFNIYLCKKYISKIAAMTTVGRGLAEEYRKNFDTNPVIITNAARFHDCKSSEVLSDKIRLIHHGIANPSRRLELMVEMMDHLDERFTLDLMLIVSNFASSGTKGYIEDFKTKATLNPRIKIIPPVPSSEVVKTINKYDMGIFLLPPVNFNYANTLPNKLFDFIQARLGIAVGPTPEMASIVNDYSLGVVSKDFSAKSMAAELSKITIDDLLKFKQNASTAATKLNAEENEKILLDLINRTI